MCVESGIWSIAVLPRGGTPKCVALHCQAPPMLCYSIPLLGAPRSKVLRYGGASLMLKNVRVHIIYGNNWNNYCIFARVLSHVMM